MNKNTKLKKENNSEVINLFGNMLESLKYEQSKIRFSIFWTLVLLFNSAGLLHSLYVFGLYFNSQEVFKKYLFFSQTLLVIAALFNIYLIYTVHNNARKQSKKIRKLILALYNILIMEEENSKKNSRLT